VLSYIDQNLISGEVILYRTRLHWISMLTDFVIALVVGLVGIAMLVSAVYGINHKGSDSLAHAAVGFTVLLLAAITVAIAFWKRSATEMAVTNKRVFVKVGLLTRRSIEIMLTKIESVSVDQSLLGRILSFGTIMVRGVGGTPEPFANIAHPLEFRRKVQEQIDSLGESRMATTKN
jgi:uncharacterized membrane protein YdbT with pleckstrin-like domain